MSQVLRSAESTKRTAGGSGRRPQLERVVVGEPRPEGRGRTALKLTAFVVVLLIFFVLVAGATGLSV